MRIKYKGVIALVLLITILSLTLTSCNLGDIDDEEDYAKKIDKVLLFGHDCGSDEYSISDFYNKDTTENMSTPLDNYEECMYLTLRVSEDMYLEDLALYFTAEKQGQLYISLYTSSSKLDPEEPDEIINPNINTFKSEIDNVQYSITFSEVKEDGNIKKKVSYSIGSTKYESTYFDLTDETGIGFTIPIYGIGHFHKCYLKPTGLEVIDTYDNKKVVLYSDDQLSYLATTSVTLDSDSWTAVQFEDMYVKGVKTKQIKLNEDDYIVLEFKNNCFDANYYGLEPLKIKMTNIMVRLVKAEE